MLLLEEIHLLNWFSHACCQSIVSMTTVNKNSLVYTVNHQGGKTRQSHLLLRSFLLYVIAFTMLLIQLSVVLSRQMQY